MGEEKADIGNKYLPVVREHRSLEEISKYVMECDMQLMRLMVRVCGVPNGYLGDKVGPAIVLGSGDAHSR